MNFLFLQNPQNGARQHSWNSQQNEYVFLDASSFGFHLTLQHPQTMTLMPYSNQPISPLVIFIIFIIPTSFNNVIALHLSKLWTLMHSGKEIGIKIKIKNLIVHIFPKHSQHRDNYHQTTTPTNKFKLQKIRYLALPQLVFLFSP
jgi:hypothetical protein